MHRYLARRASLIIPAALFSSILIFLIMSVLPGDVALTILADTPHSPEMREALRAELGLNDPYVVQYSRWLWSIITGRFGGDSLQMGIPISEMVAEELPVTLALAGYSILLSVLVSLPLGVLAATHHRRSPDWIIRTVSLGGLALPHVWLALIVMLGLLRVFGWSPPIIYSRLSESVGEHFALVIWPVLLLSWRLSSSLVRAVRSSVLGVLSSVHVTAARSRGVPERRIIWVHTLREAAIPTVTAIALQFGSLLGGTIVLEVIFGVPGLGRSLVGAAIARDYPVVQSFAMLLVLAALAINVVVDVVYTFADPRIRLGVKR